MNDAQFLSVAWNQLIQVSLLTVGVWLLTKLFARNRPHLAHAMWLVVLAKCVTPPLLESPTGLFGHLSVPEPIWFEPEEIVVEEVIEPVVPEPRVVASSPEYESEIAVDPLSQGYVLEDDALLGQLMFDDAAFELEDEPVEVAAAISKPPVAEPSVTFLPLWKLWLISAGTVMALIFLRVMCTLWRVKRHRTETPPELLELVQTLSKQFGLRRRVRVLVTSSRVGPAVVGLFRPLLILPDVVTNGRSAKELEPIIAHELLHVRRGDLGIGWLQMLVQSLWWFHPLIWLVNRLLNRETERCCDEAVLAELNCSPGTYARCLLNVLEQKRNLTPIPAFPGVKPVELTKQRMERIMKLGQGCRKRSPWWCWVVVVLLGAVVLPGTAQSQNEDLKPATQSIETRTSKAEPANAEQVLTARVYDVRELLETLRDEYQFEPNEAERALEQLVGISLSQLKVAVNPLMPEAKHDPRQCLCSGVSLFAVNTPQGHRQIKKLLELWKENGLYQVTIEGRMATVPVGFLATKLPSNQRVPLEQTESDKITTPAISSLTMSNHEFKELQELIQSNTRSNLIAFPRITIPHGTRASVMDIVQHPYIVGYKGDEPIIEVLKKGLELQLNALVREGTLTQLDCNVRHSQLHKAGGRRSREDLFEKQIELPVQALNVARMNVSLLLKSGETTLLRGLKKKSGEVEEELLVFLSATPRKLNREFLQPVADVQEQPTGKLMFGTGVNSDSGVTGSLVLDERNFDLQSPLIYESGKVVEDQKLSLGLPKLNEEQEQNYREQLATISTQLDQPWKAEYFEGPLSEVLLAFHQTLGVRFVIDRDRIAQAGLSEEVPVSFSLSGVTLRSIFEMLLTEKLAYCTIPVIDTESGSVSSTVLISTRNEIIRLTLLMQSQSIPNFNPIHFTEKRLDQPIAVMFENAKLTDALKQIANAAGITVYLDIVSLPKTVSAKTLVKDFQSKDETTLREVLEEICTPLGLIFVVEDEVLKIVDKEWHGEQPVTMVYPLAKIVGNDAQTEARVHAVIERIRTTIEPDSWTEESGYNVLFNDKTVSIIVRHKRKTHEAIAELLSKIRLETGANRDSDVKGQTASWEDLKSARSHSDRIYPHPVELSNESLSTVQIRFQNPEKARLRIDRDIEGNRISRHFELPVRHNFRAGGLRFRLTLDHIPGRVVKSEWPVPYQASRSYSWTLEVREITEQSRKYLSHNAVPVALTDEDLDQIDAGNLVTKVFYLPADSAVAGVEVIVSTRLDPRIDPVEEAKRRGTIVAVMRSLKQNKATEPWSGVLPPVWFKPDPTPKRLEWTDGAWKIQSDDLAQARTADQPQPGNVIAKVYPVADLVLPIPGTESDPHKDDPILSKLPNQSKLFKAKKKPLSDSAQPLIDLIEKSIEPESWSGEKAVGTIAFHEQNLSIVIRHTGPVHEKVSELLASLRRKQDLQVSLECLTVQFEKNSFSDFWTNVGIVIDHADASANNSMKPLIFHGVKRDDFRSKIDQFEAAQALSFPKVTVFNGVGAQIQISGAGADKESVPMMHYMIVPTISEDRRTIDVKFAVNPANTLDALTKAKSMTIPDGTSVLIEVTDELLSGPKRTGVPEVDKALRELKKKELGLRTFVLLTARIIIQEEEEELLHIPLIIQEEEEPSLGIPQSEASQPQSDSNTRIGTVTPRIIVQEEEEALLGLPQPTAEPKDRSPAPVPANPSP